MRRTSHLVLAGVFAGTFLAALSAAPAPAISNGTPDGNLHPQVGLTLRDADGDGIPSPGCSGVLIGPTVFLTAGHCAYNLTVYWGVSEAWVTFVPSFDPSDPWAGKPIHVSRWYWDPNYAGVSGFDDVGVFILDKAVRGVQYATLPPASLLDQMQAAGMLQSQTFTTVGYGCSTLQGGGPPTFPCDFTRRFALSPFAALTQYFLKVQMNFEATGAGATNLYDSGAPTFFSDTLLLAGVHSWGDSMGVAMGARARLDTASARAFLDDLVILP